MELSINLGLTSLPQTADQQLFPEMLRVYNAIRNVAYHLDRYTGAIPPPAEDQAATGTGGVVANGMFKVYLPAFEDLTVGTIVSFMDDAGVSKVRKSLDGVRRCQGFISIAGLAGAVVEITLIGKFPSYPPGTLVPGAQYFNSAVAGVIGVAGTQAVGFAMTDTDLFFNPL